MDLLLGSFADQYVPEFSEEELSLYDALLSESDPDLYNWICGKEKMPSEKCNSVTDKMIGYRYTHQSTG